jgi:hypothetical protein
VSARQTILNRLRDTILPAIATSGGYNLTVGTVKRGLYEIDALPDSSYPVLCIARTEEDRRNLENVNFVSTMSVVIVGYVKNSTGVDGAQEDLDDLIEDVTKAISTDFSLGLTGIVTNVEVRKIVTDEGDLQSLAGCAITVDIQYAENGGA